MSEIVAKELNEENESSIIERWDTFGLLPDSAKNKRNVALAMEYTFHIFTNKEHDGVISIFSKKYETIAFPIICRVFREKEEDLSYSEIKDKVFSVIQNMEEEYPKYNSLILELELIGADGEAEACALFAEKNKF